jgi:hypothetical protein
MRIHMRGRQRLTPYPFDIDQAARPIAASVLLTLKLSYS